MAACLFARQRRPSFGLTSTVGKLNSRCHKQRAMALPQRPGPKSIPLSPCVECRDGSAWFEKRLFVLLPEIEELVRKLQTYNHNAQWRIFITHWTQPRLALRFHRRCGSGHQATSGSDVGEASSIRATVGNPVYSQLLPPIAPEGVNILRWSTPAGRVSSPPSGRARSKF